MNSVAIPFSIGQVSSMEVYAEIKDLPESVAIPFSIGQVSSLIFETLINSCL